MTGFDVKSFKKQFYKTDVGKICKNHKIFIKQVSKSLTNNLAYEIQKNTFSEAVKSELKTKNVHNVAHKFIRVKNFDGAKPAVVFMQWDGTDKTRPNFLRKFFVMNNIGGKVEPSKKTGITE